MVISENHVGPIGADWGCEGSLITISRDNRLAAGVGLASDSAVAELLASALFREVRPEFFRVLSGRAGALYVDALDTLERAVAERVQGLDREDALALIEDVVAGHADVPLDDGDAVGSTAAVGSTLTMRERARAVFESLRRSGWVEEEERSDWQRVVQLHPSGETLLQALRRIAFPESVVFSDKLVSVCTTLTRHGEVDDPLRAEPWQHVESCIASLRDGIAELRRMQGAIERHTRQQLAAATLKENLSLLFDHFAEKIGHACYAELVRARLPLRLAEARRRVDDLHFDAALLTRMQDEVLRRDPELAAASAQARVQLRLDELADLLDSVVPVADAVDRRTAEFTRRSLARFRYLQETTSENRAQVQAFFEAINGAFAGRRMVDLNGDAANIPPLRLHDIRLPAGLESLYAPRLRRAAGEIAPIDDEADENQRNAAMVQLQSAMRNSLTVARANRFVDELLPDGAASIGSDAIPLRCDEDLEDLIACLLHANAADANYRVEPARAAHDDDAPVFDTQLSYRIERFILTRE